ncbi:MAG: hypothetical protein JWP69_2254 [Flaviaesturariibacter sp.]|nr:hypothetical protein [Flaviaesturariibacter sp.]
MAIAIEPENIYGYGIPFRLYLEVFPSHRAIYRYVFCQCIIVTERIYFQLVPALAQFVLLTGNFVFGGGITRTTTGISKPNAPDLEQTLYAVNDYYFQRTERYNLNTNYKYENEKGRGEH